LTLRACGALLTRPGGGPSLAAPPTHDLRSLSSVVFRQFSPFMETASKQFSPFMEMVWQFSGKQFSPFMEMVWAVLRQAVLPIYGNGAI